MASLRVGYNLFAGSSQAGMDSSIPGDIQIETAKAEKYKVKVKRLSDDYYWNNTTEAFQAGAVAEADEITVPGSDSLNPPAIRRLAMKLPAEIIALLTSDGVSLTAYASGDTPASAGVEITLAFTLVT